MEGLLIKTIKNRLCVRIVPQYVGLPKRGNSNNPSLRNREKNKVALARIYPNLVTKYWNEHLALKLQRKEKTFPKSVNSATDFLKYLQDINNFPRNFSELFGFFKKKLIKNNLINQEFLLERELVLKPDLAVATFIVTRRGKVKFLGQDYWVGCQEKNQTLPITYIPGLHVEAINAEGTLLSYEGLQTIRKLKYLRSLSLKGLSGMNDWCLDYVSREFYATLKHLDISYCLNITYRGLSCFYRFECLETLNLTGVPDTPELKLACIMLSDILPNLEIKGIDLSVPEKIDSVNLEEAKFIAQESKNSLQETYSVSGETQQASKI